MERQKASYKLKTSSVWEEPTDTFYRFLRRIENKGLPKTLAVLGCADGTYVLPAAKRGFNVFAIDIDSVALYGGLIPLYGEENHIIGLTNRLKIEGLEDNVTVVNDDFVSYSPTKKFSGVFTSGSIHYQANSHHSIAEMIAGVQSYVEDEGLLLLEYIHTSRENNAPARHFLTGQEMLSFFPSDKWLVTSNKKKKYTEGPNPRNPKIHDIVWGRLYAQKLKEH